MQLLRKVRLQIMRLKKVFNVRGSVHHRAIHKEKSNKMQQYIKILLFHIFYEAQHVLSDTPPIIRSLKLHWQPLVFHTWKVVWTLSGTLLCLTMSTNYTSNNLPHMKNQRLPVQF